MADLVEKRSDVCGVVASLQPNVPPPSIAKEMEILKRSSDGVSACSVEVFLWDQLPALEPSDGLAVCHTGVCLRCQRDMDQQLRDQGGDEDRGEIISLRSAENHMDPCFRFPQEDFGELFAGATLVEAMLVALDHMQVNYVTICSTGLRKFRRNTLSFPQDIVGFAQRHQLTKGYRVNDRVNSVRGPFNDPRNPHRPVRRVTDATDEERERYAVDSGGALVIPARVFEIFPNGWLHLQYDHGGTGVELPEHGSPRMVMPWHPKNVPLHLMLRRNLGGGRGVLEGLQVRWWYVKRLLDALCSFPRNGYGSWRLGGAEQEPMHRYYDPRLFHVMSEEEMKREYAPMEVDGDLRCEKTPSTPGSREAEP